MIGNVVGRRRFTAAERAKILADYRASGLTQRAFAEQAGVSLAALSRWLAKTRREPSPSPAVSFLEIPPVISAAAPCYKVQVPGGTSVEVPGGFVPGEVRELLRLVREL